MPVDRLSGAAHLLAALRGEVMRKTERATKQVAPAKSRDSTSTGARPRDRETLRRELADIAKSLPDQDETTMHGARRRMVRALLLWEFGSGLREHPEWQPMLESITAALEASPAHMKAFSDLMQRLKGDR